MLKYSALVALALVLNSPEYSAEHIPGHHTGLKRLQHRIVNVNVEVNLPQHHCNKKHHQQKQQQNEKSVPTWLKEEANVMDVQLADLGPDQPMPSQEQQVQPQQTPDAPVVAPADTQQQQQQPQQPQQQQQHKKKKKKKRGFNIGGIINGIQKGIQVIDQLKGISNVFGGGTNTEAAATPATPATTNEAEIDSAVDAQFDEESTTEDTTTSKPNFLSHIMDFFGSGKATQLMDHVKNIFSLFNNQGSSAEIDDAVAEFNSASLDLHDYINSQSHSAEDLHALEILAKHFLFNVDSKLLLEPSDSDEAETAYLKRDYSEYEWNLLARAQQETDIQQIEGKIHEAWINGQKDQLTALKIALHDAIAKISVAKLDRPTVGATVNSAAELDDAEDTSNGGGNFFSRALGFMGKAGQLMDHVKNIFSIFHSGNDQSSGNQAEIDSAIDENIAQFDDGETEEVPNAQAETPAAPAAPAATPRKHPLSRIFDFFSSGKASQLMEHVKNIFSIFHKQGSSAELDDATADFDSVSEDLHESINSPSNSIEDLHSLEILAKHFLFNIDQKLLQEPSSADEAETSYLRKDYSEYEWNLLSEAQQQPEILEIESKIHQAWINGEKDQLTAVKIALHNAIAKISVAKLKKTE